MSPVAGSGLYLLVGDWREPILMWRRRDAERRDFGGCVGECLRAFRVVDFREDGSVVIPEDGEWVRVADVFAQDADLGSVRRLTGWDPRSLGHDAAHDEEDRANPYCRTAEMWRWESGLHDGRRQVRRARA